MSGMLAMSGIIIIIIIIIIIVIFTIVIIIIIIIIVITIIITIITRKFGTYDNNREKNAAKWLHTRKFNELEPFQRLSFVLSMKLTIGGLMVAFLIVNYLTELTLWYVTHSSHTLLSKWFIACT